MTTPAPKKTRIAAAVLIDFDITWGELRAITRASVAADEEQIAWQYDERTDTVTGIIAVLEV